MNLERPTLRLRTTLGDVLVPDIPRSEIPPRVRYWAEVMHDLVKLDELYGAIFAAMEEAYEEGKIHGTFFARTLFESIAERPQHHESDNAGPADRPNGDAEGPASRVPGSDDESPWGV